MIQQDDDPPLRSAGPPGNQSFTSTGTSTFTVPAGVTQVSVVCVGAGGKAGIGNSGQAGGGGALAYKNNITVTPGSTATITVGAPGNHSGNNGNAGGLSKFTYNSVDYAIANGGGGGQGNHAGGNGGTYGGGHGGPQSSGSGGAPGQGAVRVIWGMGRSFPNNASQA